MISPGCRFLRLVQTIFATSVFAFSSFAQPASSPTPAAPGSIDEKLFSGMQWRQIGPFRGGRALTIEGGPGGAGAFFFWGVWGGGLETVVGGGRWVSRLD